MNHPLKGNLPVLIGPGFQGCDLEIRTIPRSLLSPGSCQVIVIETCLNGQVCRYALVPENLPLFVAPILIILPPMSNIGAPVLIIVAPKSITLALSSIDGALVYRWDSHVNDNALNSITVALMSITGALMYRRGSHAYHCGS